MLLDPLLDDALAAVPELAASETARRRLLDTEGGALFEADWLRAAFLHFALDPADLQPAIPFALDCFEGRAYVSLVAFTMRRMRLRRGGRAAALLTAPIASHPFLNVRTYVTHAGEPGIYFMTEWLPNRLSLLLGPPVFGLPYRLGRLGYEHRHEAGRIAGTVTAPGTPGALRYTAGFDLDARYDLCRPGTLDAFLLERYTAYTWHRGKGRRFRVWHRPWAVAPLDARLEDTSLLAASGPWIDAARFAAAHYTPGVRDVWMGRPARVG